MTPASLLCPQLCMANGSLKHSLRCFSVPKHFTLSKNMTPSPSPKSAYLIALAPENRIEKGKWFVFFDKMLNYRNSVQFLQILWRPSNKSAYFPAKYVFIVFLTSIFCKFYVCLIIAPKPNTMYQYSFVLRMTRVYYSYTHRSIL